jgi:hypothetical protein
MGYSRVLNLLKGTHVVLDRAVIRGPTSLADSADDWRPPVLRKPPSAPADGDADAPVLYDALFWNYLSVGMDAEIACAAPSAAGRVALADGGVALARATPSAAPVYRRKPRVRCPPLRRRRAVRRARLVVHGPSRASMCGQSRRRCAASPGADVGAAGTSSITRARRSGGSRAAPSRTSCCMACTARAGCARAAAAHVRAGTRPDRRLAVPGRTRAPQSVPQWCAALCHGCPACMLPPAAGRSART